MFKVFPTTEDKEKFQIYWCPDAPHSFIERQLHSALIYKKRQSAHRMCKKLNDGTAKDVRKSQSVKDRLNKC